jgi:hypothetical protein
LNDSRPTTCDGGGELVESETNLSRYTLQGCEHYIQKIVAQIEKDQIEKDPKNKSIYYQQLAGKYDSLKTLDGCVGMSGELWEFTRYRLFMSDNLE